MVTTRQILKIYWQHAWKYPRYVIGLLIAVPIAVISFRLVPPLIAASILARLSRHDYIQGEAWRSFSHQILIYGIITFTGGALAWRVVSYLDWKLEGYVVRDLYRTMFNKLMNLDSTFHSDNFGGALVSQTTKLINSYVRLADTFVFQVYTLIIYYVFVSLVLYSRSALFVWVLIAFSIIFIFLTYKLSQRVRKLSATEAHAQNRVTGYLADAITNVMAVKSFASTNKESSRYAEATEYTRHRTMDTMRAGIKRDLAASSITSLVQIMAIIVSVIAVVNLNANVATVFLMLTYSAAIADRLWEFSSMVLRNYNRSIGDAQDAMITLTTKPLVNDPAEPKRLEVEKGEIKIENMDFAHDNSDDEHTLFRSFNLTASPGEKIGLVGRSGSGKSSLTRLLLRFMNLDKGRILIDGQDITEVTQDDLRKSIAYVPQEPLLFHRTIHENIAYGKPEASDAEVLSAAKKAHAHEFIKDLPKGYDTLVGERGVKLSGGQRQRIAIARAMLKDAPILVLDEATSALDSESEKLIQDALWKLMEGRTTLVIAHRLSTIQRMDRIVVLEEGEVVEEGSHKELLKQNGIYASLWAHQSGGFLED